MFCGVAEDERFPRLGWCVSVSGLVVGDYPFWEIGLRSERGHDHGNLLIAHVICWNNFSRWDRGLPSPISSRGVLKMTR